jgi:hypothetical protein
VITPVRPSSVTRPRLVNRTACPVLTVRHDVLIDLEHHLWSVAKTLGNGNDTLAGSKQDAGVVVSKVMSGCTSQPDSLHCGIEHATHIIKLSI